MSDETPRPISSHDDPSGSGAPPSPSDPKDVVRRWIDACNDGDWQAEGDVRAPGYLAHPPADSGPLDGEAWTQFIAGFYQAFPDLRITLNDILSEGDMVAARIAFDGTHKGEFQGIPATNRRVSFSSIEVNRVVDGKVEEHWFQLDQLTMLQQLGMAVLPGPRLASRIGIAQAKKLRSRFSRRH